MHKIRLIALLLLFALQTAAQDFNNFEEVNNTTYSLFALSKWDDLIKYGNKAIEYKQDFLNLRLRLGFACISKKNYAKAIIHYKKVLTFNKYDEIAHYYLWLCYNALNQESFALQHYPFINKDIQKTFSLKKIALTAIGIENSFKTTDVTTRNDAFYNRLSLNCRLGWRVNMQQSVAHYKQNISEPKLTLVENNNSININQVEYYNLISISLNKNIEVKTAFHYIKTPFNNFSYSNHLGLIGIKFYGNNINWQGAFIQGTLVDSKINQYNLQSEYFPLGSNSLYGISTLSYRTMDSSGNTNFKQVLGFKVNKTTWLEANVTLGEANRYLENDALYVFNSIDPNMLKWGCNAYYFLGKHLKLQLGYTMEKRKLTLYNPQLFYFQHSLNGGISWKF